MAGGCDVAYCDSGASRLASSVAVSRSTSWLYLTWLGSMSSAAARRRPAVRAGFRCERASTRRACLDPRCFVDLVAKCSDFGPAPGDDAADVQRRSPVQTGADRDVVGRQVVTCRDLERRGLQRSHRVDARARRCGYRTGRLRDEEGGDAVIGVTAHEPTSVDHALVGRASESPNQSEVARRREAFRQLGRAFEIANKTAAGRLPRSRPAASG